MNSKFNPPAGGQKLKFLYNLKQYSPQNSGNRKSYLELGEGLSFGNSRHIRSGFSMVETLIAIGVFGIFFAAVALILQQVLQNVGESRVRTTALALAQSKMEIIRNLPYQQVGTAGGIPQGPINQTETVDINSLPFTVKTSVIYVDDPFDGLTPLDLINTDYKRARVEITWAGIYPSRYPVTLVTNIAPKGVETLTSGGTLKIQVFNSAALPVSNADVRIDNASAVPEIHIQTLTDSNGLVILPGSPQCISCYQIVVNKTSFSTDKTYSTAEVTNPLQPFASVFDGEITEISFAIDTVSSLTINAYGTKESGYPPVGNVLFNLRGSKIIGYDSSDNPVYKFNLATGTVGNTRSISNLEWDTYNLDFSTSFHNLAGSNPVVPFGIPPSTNLTVPIVAIPKTNNNLLLIVQNSANELLASASARLSNSALSYDVTKTTGATGSADFGQVFFGGLENTTYELDVNLPPYEEATSSILISGIKQETMTLNQTQ